MENYVKLFALEAEMPGAGTCHRMLDSHVRRGCVQDLSGWIRHATG